MVSDKILNKTDNSKISKEFVISLLLFLVFSSTTIYGVIKIFDNSFPSVQAILIIVESCAAILVTVLPVLIHKLSGMKISMSIIIMIEIFLLCGVAGEVFELYYTLSWWDKMLHIVSGFAIAFIAFCVFDYLTRESNLKHKFAICIIFAVCISMAAGLLWEFAEFILDSIFGTNMQKFMPESETFFNGGFTHEVLNGTNEDLVAFFRTPEGYRYALMDTMGDVICNLCGIAAFGNLCVLTRKRADLYNRAIIKDIMTGRVKKSVLKKGCLVSENDAPEYCAVIDFDDISKSTDIQT